MNPIRPFTKKLVAGALIFAGTALSLSTGLAQTMPHKSKFDAVGTVNCTSSTCHGSIKERSSTPVLQNEYTTWLRQDPHTQAYDVLLNDQSKTIAKNLGLTEGAHNASVCLDCHSNNIPKAQRGERFDVTDGVNCEACHGPAGEWISSHVEKGATHANNIEHGLYPTNNPYSVAKLCLSCHQGDETRPITHQIMGAGHPRLSIEVETFMALEPPHYRIDEDWVKRKGAYSPGKIWAMGQFAASENLLKLIADPKRNKQGLLPEFMMYDCHACHAPMDQKTWMKGMASAPGQPRLNDSSLLMVGAIIKALDSKAYPEFEDMLSNLHRAATSTSSTMQELTKASTSAQLKLAGMRSMVAQAAFNNPALEAIFRELVNLAATGRYTDYAGAEQAFMSISSVANSLSQNGESFMASQVNPGLSRMLVILRDEDKYDRVAFQNELQRMKKLVGGS